MSDLVAVHDANAERIAQVIEDVLLPKWGRGYLRAVTGE